MDEFYVMGVVLNRRAAPLTAVAGGGDAVCHTQSYVPEDGEPDGDYQFRAVILFLPHIRGGESGGCTYFLINYMSLNLPHISVGLSTNFVEIYLQCFEIVFQLSVHIIFTNVCTSYSFQTFFAGNMLWRVCI